MGRSKTRPGVKSNVKYTQQQLICAIQEVNNGSSQFAAAKKYSIPRSTLFNKISGKTLMGKKSGPGTVLSTEEEHIVKKWMFTLGARGFPVTKGQLLRSIQLYLNNSKRKTIFTNNFPGRKWFDSFLKRHPTIRERLSQNLTPSRAAVTAKNIRFWHSEIRTYCEENNLLDVLSDSSRVFNMDEKGFILTKKSEVVLVEKGTKAVYSRSKNDEKECVTALLGGSASGKPTPPMVVHSYKRMPTNILLNLPPKWTIGISDNGWQTQQTFYDYMTNVFYPWLLEEQIQLPVIVYIDGHKSHVSLSLSNFCAANQIVLIGLYPNSTHLTQPMDVGVFKSLNASWETTSKQWRLDGNFRKIDKKDVAPILNDSINAINYSELLKTAFKTSGLFPFNADNINFSRILPNLAACTTSQDELWNPKVPTVSESNKITSEVNVVENACCRLKHIESLIGDSVLELFRLSSDNWTGASEYSALFTIWKQIYKEASEATSAVNSNSIIVDVDIAGEFILHEGETWLIEDSDEVVIHEQYTGEQNSHLITTNSTCNLSSDREQLFESEVSVVDSMDVELNAVAINSDEFGFVWQFNEEENGLLKSTKSIKQHSNNGERPEGVTKDQHTEKEYSLLMTNSICDASKDGEQLLESEVSVVDSMDVVAINAGEFGFGKQCDNKENSLPMAIISIGDPNENCLLKTTKSISDNVPVKDVVHNAILESGEKGTVVLASCNGFNPDAFKSSFFWPVGDVKNKQKKATKEKQSSVFSGDVWRNNEIKKLEQKIQKDAEKEARKVEREKKKENAEKIAAEKKVLKEKKILEAVKMAAEKEKKRLEKQRAIAQKRTCKATLINCRTNNNHNSAH